MAHDGVGLVYGGSCVGLMGVLADEVLDAGGEVIGVVPRQLSYQELAHDSLTELHEVATMHERKHKMQALSQGCIALPGGFGTLWRKFRGADLVAEAGRDTRASPALRTPRTLATRCRRQACSPTGTAARSPISTATARSPTCCVRPRGFPG